MDADRLEDARRKLKMLEDARGEFLQAINDNDAWNTHNSYLAFRLPGSPTVDVKYTARLLKCSNEERNWLVVRLEEWLNVQHDQRLQQAAKLQELLGRATERGDVTLSDYLNQQQITESQTHYQHTVTLYYSVYTTCSDCVVELVNFVKRMKDQRRHIKLDIRTINVRKSTLCELGPTQRACSLVRGTDQDYLTLKAFEEGDLQNVMKIIQTYAAENQLDLQPLEMDEINKEARTILKCKTLINWKIKALLSGKVPPPGYYHSYRERQEIFDKFYMSYLHGAERSRGAFCIVRLPHSQTARVYENKVDYAEISLVKDLKRDLLEMELQNLNRNEEPFRQDVTVYQNFSPCHSCPKNVLIPFIESMQNRGINLNMVIKAVGPYNIERAHCVASDCQCYKSGSKFREPGVFQETAEGLRLLNDHSHIDLTSFQSFQSWDELVILINETLDLVDEAVSFTDDEYKALNPDFTKKDSIDLAKSRAEEDEGVTKDFYAVLTHKKKRNS